MSSNSESWKEWKAEVAPGPIYSFTRGYSVNEAGRHENAEQYRAFQFYMNSGGSRSIVDTAEFIGLSPEQTRNWSKKYNWEKRAAAFDKKQITAAFKQASKIEKTKQRKAIQEFRQANEDQAKLMMDVSSDLMDIIKKRIAQAESEGEVIPMGLVSGLMRAAANISDSGRQAWATSLGINELMNVVDQELEDSRSDVEEVDVYEIPLDE